MSWIKRVESLVRRRKSERELSDELQHHIDLKMRENIEAGMPPEEARYAALRAFGGMEQKKEACRDTDRLRWMQDLIQDVHYGLRQLRRNPGFTTVAVITLALGIGANTVIFSVVNAVLLQSLPYRNPDRVVLITGGATQARYEEIKAAARSYTGMGAFAVGVEDVAISGNGAPEALKGARVSANFLQILGTNPLLGRSFLPEDDLPGGRQVVMISAALWRRRFGSDPRLVGRIATFNLKPYTIIGVLPAGFAFPFPGADVWLPRPWKWSRIPPKYRPISPILKVFGRLKPEVSLKQASAELAVLNRQYALTHPLMLDAKPHSAASVTPLKEELVSGIRPVLGMLFGAVGFVLLIACANVASLLMARAAFRSREFAVRGALGAGRGRLIRQVLVESLLLSFGGGACGLLVARCSLSGIAGTNLLDLPRAGELRLDSVVLGFTLAVCIVTGILSGVLPALWTSRRDLMEALQERGARPTPASGRPRALGFSARGLLVTVQIALSIVLLIAAALLMGSLVRMEEVNPGFEPRNLLTMRIALPATRYGTPQQRARFLSEVVRSIDSAPGISHAAVMFTLPTAGWAGSPVAVVGQPPVTFNKRPIAIIQCITPEYFRALAIPLERGREFTRDDVQGSVQVAVISDSLARRFWPDYPKGENPVGQHLWVGAYPQPVEIVGIVANVHEAGLDVQPTPEVYQPFAQRPLQSVMLAVRTKGNPLGFVNVVRSRIHAIDPDQALSSVRTMRDVVQESLGRPRMMTLLVGVFAGLALLLATVGLYGVVAYSTAQRTHEMGIRIALGATRLDVLRLVLGQGLRLGLAGILIGESGAYALTRVMKSLLFHVSATDPTTFAAIAVVFIFVTLLAAYVPARRATKVDPMVALRCE
jgi:putative ABC transport system permease protein